MEQQNLRNLRDFLYMYNNISEHCFHTCVNSLFEREIRPEEVDCINRCTDKHTNANQKILSVFVEVQPQILQRRVESLQQQQPQEENEQVPSAQTQEA